MATRSITTVTELTELAATEPLVVLDFWADWCGPCKAFAPVFEAAAEANEDICFVKVDADQAADLSRAFGIMSIPTVAVMRNGELVHAKAGALSRAAFDELLAEVRAGA